MAKFDKVVTNENDMFQGYVTEDGVKVEGTDREFASKIAIGSALGRIIKGLQEAPEGAVKLNSTVEVTPPVEKPLTMIKNETSSMEPTIEVDPSNGDDFSAITEFRGDEIIKAEVMETPVVEEVPVAETPAVKEQKMIVDDKATDRTAQRETYLTRLHKRVEETIQIDGVTVHVIDSNWASSIKLRKGAVEYSFEIISPTEIFLSRTIDPALGVCYFDAHAPKIAGWLNDGLLLEDTGQTIHNIEKLKYDMLVWNFSNYKIIAIKK